MYYGNLKYSTTFLYSSQTDTHVRVSNGPAEFHYRNGAWYRIDGGSLYAIRF
ncbi:hypothetical protein [Paenibacillus sp. Soil522]|uniref:hypothetical protein n=1 Tax=Paenibacillus sp. Soil522 TaxID=1736388 RepID=UPI00138F6557|nr:hypothetical protein [Paenibacillus sp. Soil522]